MILTDDNFSTIVKAVEIGRALYDNLKKYVRFQIGVLLGFIVTFLGSSIFNVANGVPFEPLQSIWINFTTDLFLAIGLGYGTAASGLMQRKPRAADEAVLPRPLVAWLAIAGFVMGVVTIAIISWATSAHDLALGRTMGFTAFCIANVAFAVTTKDERRSIFNMDTFSDTALLKAVGACAVVIILQTTLNPLQRLLQMVPLDLAQWLGCIAGGLVIVVVSELRKLLIHRTID